MKSAENTPIQTLGGHSRRQVLVSFFPREASKNNHGYVWPSHGLIWHVSNMMPHSPRLQVGMLGCLNLGLVGRSPHSCSLSLGIYIIEILSV